MNVTDDSEGVDVYGFVIPLVVNFVFIIDGGDGGYGVGVFAIFIVGVEISGIIVFWCTDITDDISI